MELPPVAAPTMGVWSRGDFALTEAQMTGSADVRDGPVALRARRGRRPLDAARAAGRVNALLLDFLPPLSESGHRGWGRKRSGRTGVRR